MLFCCSTGKLGSVERNGCKPSQFDWAGVGGENQEHSGILCKLPN